MLHKVTPPFRDYSRWVSIIPCRWQIKGKPLIYRQKLHHPIH